MVWLYPRFDLPHFVQPIQAKVPVKFFNKCPHNPIPLCEQREARTALFPGRFASPSNRFRARGRDG
jgi:hypothetical protein